jgi:hypothetical protein
MRIRAQGEDGRLDWLTAQVDRQSFTRPKWQLR